MSQTLSSLTGRSRSHHTGSECSGAVSGRNINIYLHLIPIKYKSYDYLLGGTTSS